MEEMVITELDTETGVVAVEPCEDSGNGVLGLALIGGLCAAVGGLWFATRKRRKQRRIEKLKKEGYLIYAPDEVMEAEEDCEDID